MDGAKQCPMADGTTQIVHTSRTVPVRPNSVCNLVWCGRCADQDRFRAVGVQQATHDTYTNTSTALVVRFYPSTLLPGEHAWMALHSNHEVRVCR